MKTLSALLVAFAIGVSAEEQPAHDVNIRGAVSTHAAPRIRMKIGDANVLSQPTGLVNKNTLAMDNNVAITRSNLLFSQNDRLQKEDDTNEQPSEDTAASKEQGMPTGVSLVGASEPLREPATTAAMKKTNEADEQYYYRRHYYPYYRHRFRYPYYGGWRYGWRYPLWYWNDYASTYYTDPCYYGQIYGGYYYC